MFLISVSLCNKVNHSLGSFVLPLRIDRLRHQLLPVYSYDPSEELNEAEQEMWREEDTRVCFQSLVTKS